MPMIQITWCSTKLPKPHQWVDLHPPSSRGISLLFCVYCLYFNTLLQPDLLAGAKRAPTDPPTSSKGVVSRVPCLPTAQWDRGNRDAKWGIGSSARTTRATNAFRRIPTRCCKWRLFPVSLFKLSQIWKVWTLFYAIGYMICGTLW